MACDMNPPDEKEESGMPMIAAELMQDPGKYLLPAEGEPGA